MGHPPMSSSFDDEGDDYEEEDEEDEDEDEDEDDEGEDDDDGEEDGDDDEDGFNWSLHLPVRLAPLLITLQKIRNGQETPPAPITATSTTTITTTTATTTTATSAASGAVSIRQLHQMVVSQRIFDDEVLTTVGAATYPINIPSTTSNQHTLYHTLLTHPIITTPSPSLICLGTTAGSSWLSSRRP